MATAWKLVPISWLKQNAPTVERAPVDSTHNSNASSWSQAPIADFDTYEETPRLSDLDSVLDILPKRYKNKARALAHYLKRAGCTVNEHLKLVYPDKEIGSSAYELLTYALTPPHIKKGRPHPIDYKKFVALLHSEEVPTYLYDSGNYIPAKEWDAKTKTLNTRKNYVYTKGQKDSRNSAKKQQSRKGSVKGTHKTPKMSKTKRSLKRDKA